MGPTSMSLTNPFWITSFSEKCPNFSNFPKLCYLESPLRIFFRTYIFYLEKMSANDRYDKFEIQKPLGTNWLNDLLHKNWLQRGQDLWKQKIKKRLPNAILTEDDYTEGLTRLCRGNGFWEMFLAVGEMMVGVPESVRSCTLCFNSQHSSLWWPG